MTGLVVTADVLSAGSNAVLEQVLHEAAHLLSWVRDDKDVSSRGFYHNGRFLRAAETVGLQWPRGAVRTLDKGFDGMFLTDDTKKQFATDLRSLSAAIPQVLPHLVVPDVDPATSPRRTPRLYMQCRCAEPRRLQIARSVAARGPVLCGVCGKEFTAA